MRKLEHVPYLITERSKLLLAQHTVHTNIILVLFSVSSDVWGTSAKPVHFPVPKQEALNKTSKVQMTELPTSLLMRCLGTTQTPGLWSIQSCSLFPTINQIIPHIAAAPSLVIWPAAKTQEDARSKPCDWRKILFSLWAAFSLQLCVKKKCFTDHFILVFQSQKNTHTSTPAIVHLRPKSNLHWPESHRLLLAEMSEITVYGSF